MPGLPVGLEIYRQDSVLGGGGGGGGGGGNSSSSSGGALEKSGGQAEDNKDEDGSTEGCESLFSSNLFSYRSSAEES